MIISLRGITSTSLLTEGRKTAALAFPLIIGQVSQTLMMIADSRMVGQLGVTELAALAFANIVFSILFILGSGVLTSISILTSEAAGKDEAEEARKICRHGFFLSLASGCLLCLLGFASLPLIHLFGQPAEVTAMTPPYLSLLAVSLIPALASLALKNHSDSLEHPWPSFWIFLGGVVLNIILNQLLIFNAGWGLPGAGWATLISRCAIVVAMLWWFSRSKKLVNYVPRRWFTSLSQKTLRRLFFLGVPASLQVLAEWGAFLGAGILIGHFGETSLAAHQIALNTSIAFYMIPMGLAMALTMRVGRARGAGETERFAPLIASGWIITLGSLTLTAIACTAGRELIAGFYVDDAEVIALALSLIMIVAISQAVDAFQCVSAGMLRGFEDVKIPAWAAFLAYWVVGLPLGYGLAHYAGWGAIGIWWGLASGLAVAAIFLFFRVLSQLSRQGSLRHLNIEAAE